MEEITEYSFLEEQMTEEEVDHFNHAIIFTLKGQYVDADYHVAHIGKDKWDKIHKYLNSLMEANQNYAKQTD